MYTYTTSGSTGSTLALHSDGRSFASLWLLKSCDLWPSFAPCNTWSSGGTALCRVGSNGQSIESTLSGRSVAGWPLSVASCGRLQLGALH